MTCNTPSSPVSFTPSNMCATHCDTLWPRYKGRTGGGLSPLRCNELFRGSLRPLCCWAANWTVTVTEPQAKTHQWGSRPDPLLVPCLIGSQYIVMTLTTTVEQSCKLKRLRQAWLGNDSGIRIPSHSLNDSGQVYLLSSWIIYVLVLKLTMVVTGKEEPGAPSKKAPSTSPHSAPALDAALDRTNTAFSIRGVEMMSIILLLPVAIFTDRSTDRPCALDMCNTARSFRH